MSKIKDAADKGKFLSVWNGNVVSWSKNFFGNQTVPNSYVNMFKNANINKLGEYSRVTQGIRFLNGFNYGYPALGILNGISSGNYYSAFQNGVDLGMNYVSTMGIPGFLIGTAWTFGGKALFWWGAENTYQYISSPDFINSLDYIRGR